MTRRYWLLFLLAAGCSDHDQSVVDSDSAAPAAQVKRTSSVADQPFDTESVRSAVAAWHVKQDGLSNLDQETENNLQTITVFPMPDHPELCLAICDYQREWWGFFGVYGLEVGKIVWQAECSDPPAEQSIRWLRGLKLDGFACPIVEVYGQTHMGNGNLYLYELVNQKLVKILETRAVDCHLNGDAQTFKGGRLLSRYLDLNEDGVADLLLTGEIEQHGMDDDKANEYVVLSTFPCQNAFLWNSASHRYEEDLSRRIGLSDDVR